MEVFERQENRIIKGRVIKGIAGFYYVDTEYGVFRAKGRGIFRNKGKLLVVGDIVTIAIDDEQSDARIESISPRRNEFSRPPVSNIDKLIVVCSIVEPEINFLVIDKLLATAEKNYVKPILCINKTDLVTKEELKEIVTKYECVYEVIEVSAMTGEGIQSIINTVSSSSVAFAGPSGSGKSTLINRIVKTAYAETGTLSEKTLRGRHTTRHVEIFKCGNGYIFDTPGFTSFDLKSVDESDLGALFPEIKKASTLCRFRNCRHINEPECEVKNAVTNGKIATTRYDSYISCLNEIREGTR